MLGGAGLRELDCSEVVVVLQPESARETRMNVNFIHSKIARAPRYRLPQAERPIRRGPVR